MEKSRLLTALSLVAALLVPLVAQGQTTPAKAKATKVKQVQAPVRTPEVDCRPCGAPSECQLEPAAAEKLRAAKKRIMLYDYPARIVDKLVDPLPPCAMCVWGASEGTVDSGVAILVNEKRGVWHESDWTRENELVARDALKKGKVRGFYFVHLNEACTCCMKDRRGSWVRQTEPRRRRDWDRDFGFNKDATVKFEKPSDLGPEPADLKGAANYYRFK